jgi:hypothetical protein
MEFLSRRDGGRTDWPMLWVLLALAAALHVGLLASGHARLSNDESVRVLMALELSAANALEPWIWPPLHRILLGLLLKLHGDVTWVPALFTVGLALWVMAALVALTRRITDDRRAWLVAGLLALVSPFRLLLGSVPMADILMLALVVTGAERVLAWLQGRGPGALLAGCALVGLGTAVRYEAWFVAMTLGLTLAWRWWRTGRPGFATLAGAGVLLSAFPVFWVVDSWVWYGSLTNLAITPEQFQAITGEDAVRISVLLNPLVQPLWQDLAYNPATPLGAAMLVVLARRDIAFRGFAAAFMTAFPLMGLTMLATTAISLAAPWRLVATWSLLLLPFGALALVRLAKTFAAWFGRRPALLLPALLVPALLLPAWRDAKLLRSAAFNWETNTWRHDAEAGRAAAALAAAAGGRVVVDSLGNLDFLEVMVGSGRPDLFVTSADAPASGVALHVPMARVLRERGDPRTETYLADRFGLLEGGAPGALAARGIRAALVRDPGARAALDESPLAERVAAWPDWTLYRLRPEALAQRP